MIHSLGLILSLSLSFFKFDCVPVYSYQKIMVEQFKPILMSCLEWRNYAQAKWLMQAKHSPSLHILSFALGL